MAVTNYYSFGGEILGEETGGVRRDYLTDALGSVTATVTGAGTVENTYRYKPYGETLAKTGTGGDPKFLWNGLHGISKNLNDNLFYIRHRFYNSRFSRWISLDPIYKIPIDELYLYCKNNPVLYIDPFGLKETCKSKCPEGGDPIMTNCYSKPQKNLVDKDKDNNCICRNEQSFTDLKRNIGLSLGPWNFNFPPSPGKKNYVSKIALTFIVYNHLRTQIDFLPED